ncbi:Tll0287-like domain-containing protein [Methylobacterium sp. JK268]
MRRAVTPLAVVLAALVASSAGRAVEPSGALPPGREGADPGRDDRRVAEMLAAMLRAGRTVISQAQDAINDPAPGPKGLDGDAVLARSVAIYRRTTGTDPETLPPDSREGRLLRHEMAAIKEVVDANQGTIEAAGTGFKGFIPAVFARLVSESFSRRAEGEATMKVTAPARLVRNRKARPDAWEAAVIDTRFLMPDWPTGKSYEAVVEDAAAPLFRVAVPEYYSASCLGCHGAPKGDLDVTGYPKEGAAVGDLGGVISIKLRRS